jgi:hypothetical protein
MCSRCRRIPSWEGLGWVPLKRILTCPLLLHRRPVKNKSPMKSLFSFSTQLAGQRCRCIQALAAGLLFIALLMASAPAGAQSPAPKAVYKVQRLKKPITIDGNWNKAAWKKIKPVTLTHFMGAIPPFRPAVQAKMMYDADNVYVIFQVHDQYVRSVIEKYNGPVSTEACVELFFSPDTAYRDKYFNLEINAGGTPLMAYHVYKQKEYPLFTPEDFARITIAHSLPRKVDPPITEPVTWTIEYRLPVDLLEKYGSVVRPKKGTVWRANFYKTASKSTNPHWITWARVDLPAPAFHSPQFFGTLLFR